MKNPKHSTQESIDAPSNTVRRLRLLCTVDT